MVTIRPATRDDAPRIVEMSHDLCEHEGGPPSTLTAEAFVRHGFGASRLFTCYVAELAGEAVGHIGLTDGFEFGDGCPFVWIAELYVCASTRRAGVARALMARAARHAAEIGAGHLQWSMVPNNAEARAFYASLGALQDTARYLYLEEEAMRTLAAERIG